MFEHPTGKEPERVVILGAGPSHHDFSDIMGGSNAFEYDEVWALNNMGRCFKTDLLFVMDDYAVFKSLDCTLAEFMRNTDVPIITSVPRTDCPTALAYPLAEVLSQPNIRPYLNHTVAYMLAYAALVPSVKEIYVFGADYISANQPYDPGKNGQHRARYMAAASYWAGYLGARGVDVIATSNSPFLNGDSHENFYGYIIQPNVKYSDKE